MADDVADDAEHPPGWWQASDLNWYPPELHADPDHRAAHGAPQPSLPPASEHDDLILPPPDAAPPRPPVDSGRPRHALEQPDRFRSSALVWGGGLALLVGIVVVTALLALDGGNDEPASPAVADEGAMATPLVGPTVGTTAATTVGRPDQPAAFGELFGWPEWRGTVVDVIDTTDTALVDDRVDPPLGGRSHVVVLYEATYLGAEIAAFEPFLIDSPSTTVHATSACFVDDVQLEGLGVQRNRFELVPGQTARFAECIEIDSDAVDGLVVSLSNVNVFASDIAYAADGDALPALEDHGLIAGERDLPTVPFGTELTTEAWTAAVVDVIDAEAAGLLAGFSDPPAEGNRYLAIVFTATHLGDGDSDFIPLRITGIGSEVYEPINGCWLDEAELAARGVQADRSLARPDEMVTLADCIEVPEAELDRVAIRLEDGLSADDEAILYAVGDQ